MKDRQAAAMPPSCARVTSLVLRDSERELTSEEAQSVATHLAECERCAAELTRGAELDGWLRVADRELPSALEWRRVDRAVYQEIGRLTPASAGGAAPIARPASRPVSRLIVFGRRASVVLAALFVLAVSIFVAIQNTGGPNGRRDADRSFSLMAASENLGEDATQVIFLPDTDEEAIVVYLASNS